MSAPAPRIEISLSKIEHNAHSLVTRLATQGISVFGITKATLGCPIIAQTLVRSGVLGIGDSRISNIRSMVQGKVDARFMLTRSPMPSEIDAVVRYAGFSLNTEIQVIKMLSKAAKRANRQHGILLMVELGDLREGLMPADLPKTATTVMSLPNIFLAGIGCNLACYGGVTPDTTKMNELSALADLVEQQTGQPLEIISGGNSANLEWAMSDGDCGRINNLRLGESILLGRETLQRKRLAGLHTDAFSIVAEVIESKVKPSRPYGHIAQTAFGPAPTPNDKGDICRCILALGRQDCDPNGLTPPKGFTILGASSDHLILESSTGLSTVGSEVAFQPNYSALLAAMTSPYIAQKFV